MPLEKYPSSWFKISRSTTLTTHSDIILDVLGKMPESILVCEKHDGKTEITRLDEENVKPFLEQNSLGNMWNSNIIGGRRW